MPKAGVPAPGFVKRIGPIIDARRAVQFHQLRSLDLMNRLTGVGMPFDWTINPYRGCEVGCAYCYARPTHEYLGHVDPVEFEERIYVKQAETDRLVGALRRARAAGQQVAIGTATDPYQPAEGRFEVTRSVLRTLLEVPGVSVSITTKCASVTRDLDLLEEVTRTCRLTVNMSLISMDRDLLRLIEPRAPRPDLRLAAVETLASRGVLARLFVMPVLPGLTDGEAATRELLSAAARAGARQAIWNVLFLRGSTRGFFLAFLGREFPWLVPRYRELYGSGAWVTPSYRAEVDRMMERLAAAVGLSAIDRDERVKREGPATPRQLTLSW